MSANEFVKVGDVGRVARLTLAHPPVNVLNIAIIKHMNDYLESLSTREGLCALLIDAEGPMFSAGVDVPEHRRESVEEMITVFHRTIRLIDNLPMPVVAAIHGGAYGGGMELAIISDIVLASDDAKIGVPEITLGVYPPVAIACLSRIVGLHRAAELILTGRVLDATEAATMGLVNHVYPAATFRTHTTTFVTQLTRLSAFSLRHARRALRRASWAGLDDALATSEQIYLKELMSGSDPSEGLEAFSQKRKPVWLDR